MAPSRGNGGQYGSLTQARTSDQLSTSADQSSPSTSASHSDDHARSHAEAQEALAERANAPENFTIRGVLVGLVIGIVICFSNIYFGLQTGWISGMAMPSALLGFGFFRAISSKLTLPFSPVENVLIQTVASSVGTMPLGCGFVGVMPALEYLLTPEENGPLRLSLGKLMLWAVGICLFGVVFAVPLRKQVIIREKLKFPTGSATALMIGVLHGEKEGGTLIEQDEDDAGKNRRDDGGDYQPVSKGDRQPVGDDEVGQNYGRSQAHLEENDTTKEDSDWKDRIKLLTFAFFGSSLYTIGTYFIPQVRDLPIFGLPMATTWLWALNPSPAYVGQGIIMGPTTTAHMLFGAILGWGVLSPLAKHKGWAPGEVNDWEDGSKGWIVWISLAIMLADALVSLGWLILRPVINFSRRYGHDIVRLARNGQYREIFHYLITSDTDSNSGYSALPGTSISNPSSSTASSDPTPSPDPEIDAPPSHLISTRVFIISALLSVAIYFASLHLTFPRILPFLATFSALILALLLSLMGVRALGETDLNPVSGISKLTQLVFALLIPASSNPNAIIVNLLAGAISESGALQAGDLLQDLKTGHLLGAAPKAQFYGQLIGSVVGAVVSAAVYKLYTAVYTIPGPQFQVPTAYVWVFTARLVTGSGLPPRSAEFAAGFAALFALLTIIRTRLTVLRLRGEPEKAWASLVPGGIAVAVGMYNTPSFTLARAAGGAIAWYWVRWRGKRETGVVVLASGLILGEGLCSIVNLGLAAVGAPHL